MQITDSRQLRIEHVLQGQTPNIINAYRAPARIGQHPRIAIIFVHGFISNTINTWGVSDDWYFWPIHVGIKLNCDIFCLEYLNNALNNSVRVGLDIDDISQILINKLYETTQQYHTILFVTHSFGGILIKNVYSQIVRHKEPGVAAIKSKIKGIYMISCPHRGHVFAYNLRIIMRFIMSGNFRLLGSRRSTRIHESFLTDYHNNKRTLVCKTAAEQGALYWIFRVNPFEAELDDDTDHHVDERNHSNICKCLKEDDPMFVSIANFLEQRISADDASDRFNPPLFR